jgi:hypothetical protein
MHSSFFLLEHEARAHQQALHAEADNRRLARAARRARLARTDDTPCPEQRPLWRRRRFLIGVRQTLPC